ncbi:hypothetical protein [Perigonia lusca single nucleopolyhedrovirus]|uniref:Uncharacterized protein n=1 Tax=Perigonia lusca single nucleopolyhedrovirus TaxID=1675865 RepID=A0A0M3WPC4_9ABAC|nr:hypothetical protein [Perigonia lusca single nucleopolyhedrovirus]AKN80676.1 hypothetical protein [Perigonia lusca single nucleopolyhedrovirus]
MNIHVETFHVEACRTFVLRQHANCSDTDKTCRNVSRNRNFLIHRKWISSRIFDEIHFGCMEILKVCNKCKNMFLLHHSLDKNYQVVFLNSDNPDTDKTCRNVSRNRNFLIHRKWISSRIFDEIHFGCMEILKVCNKCKNMFLLHHSLRFDI